MCNLRSKRETEEVLRVDISDSREAAGAEKEMNEFWGGFRFSYGLKREGFRIFAIGHQVNIASARTKSNLNLLYQPLLLAPRKKWVDPSLNKV